MQKVLLCCQSLSDARFLKNYMETELPYQVQLAANQSEIEPALRTQNIHMLMLQTGQLAQQDITYALQLRSRGYGYPILMITDALGGANVDELNGKHRIYFLERPFELATLKGVSRKLMITRNLPQQIFRRYRTNVAATIETFVSGDTYASHMFNLSRGGAYFELTQKPMLGVGDLMRLKVHLKDMDREHHIHGRVMWTTHKGSVAGGYGLGVQFIKAGEMYQNLLDKV